MLYRSFKYSRNILDYMVFLIFKACIFLIGLFATMEMNQSRVNNAETWGKKLSESFNFLG